MMWFCSLSSGSSGNCIYVGSERANILVDAGISGKKIGASLKEIGISAKDIDCILVTHEHSDHIHGVGVMSRMFNVPIYANNNTWEAMQGEIGDIKEENIRVLKNDDPFSIGDIDIKAYSIPHDAADPVGYCFWSGGKKISIATDMGHVSENVLNNIKESDLVLLESNHDVEMLKAGPYPYTLKRRILSSTGHLSNDDAGETVAKLLNDKYMTVVLGHLSAHNNYPELAYATVMSILNEHDIKVDRDISIELAGRQNVSRFFEL